MKTDWRQLISQPKNKAKPCGGNERVVNQGNNEFTVIKALAMPSAAMFGSPSAVDVKDGKVIRIRSFHYDSKYTKESIICSVTASKAYK